MNWYRLSLVGDIEKVNQAAWQSAWEVSQVKAHIDYSSAIFKKIDAGDGLTLYFTPSAQSLAETFGARPCGKPSRVGMSLFAGDHRAWQIHFAQIFWKRSTDKYFIDTHPSRLFESTWPSQFQ